MSRLAQVTRRPPGPQGRAAAVLALLLALAICADAVRNPTYQERRRAYLARATTRREAIRQQQELAALRASVASARQQAAGSDKNDTSSSSTGSSGAPAVTAGGPALASSAAIPSSSSAPAGGGSATPGPKFAYQEVTVGQQQPPVVVLLTPPPSTPGPPPNKERAFEPNALATGARVAGDGNRTWQVPPVRANWQYQLGQAFDPASHLLPNVTVYDVDLFDTPPAAVAAIRAAGGYPICYFSVGYENWRPDKDSFPPESLGAPMEDWDGERWTDLRHPAVLKVMRKRLQLCKDKGFLGAEPDNVDIAQLKTGLKGFTADDQLAFIVKLAGAAHDLGLAMGLKNDLLQVKDLVGVVDFAVNESCSQFKECKYYLPFHAAGIPVFNVEYERPAFDRICPKAAKVSMTSIFKAIELKASPRTACPGMS